MYFMDERIKHSDYFFVFYFMFNAFVCNEQQKPTDNDQNDTCVHIKDKETCVTSSLKPPINCRSVK
jgi:hypothetical protein